MFGKGSLVSRSRTLSIAASRPQPRISPTIGELPKGVDLVVFVVPARVVVRMIDDCGARGVRGIMVVSSGFAEAGADGAALQEQLRVAAVRTGIPVLGPNVEGFVNYVDRVAPYGTTPPPEPLPGSISVISQSGTVATLPVGSRSPSPPEPLAIVRPWRQ